LHDTLIKALNTPQVRSRLTDIAVEVIASTPQEYANRLRDEIAVWGKVVAAAGLKGKQVN
jgi:tripartite-type tricarboxylate transporter receptor subunit TctC